MKYLLILFLSFFSISAFSQGIYNKAATNIKQNRLMADSVLGVPRDTSSTNNATFNGVPVGDSGRIAYQFGKFWGHDGTGWTLLGSQAIDTTKFIRNGTSPQTANYNITGNGTVGSTLKIATTNPLAAPLNVGTLPSYLNKSAYFEGTIRIDKGVALDDAITLQQFRDSGLYVNPRWFGAVPDDGVSDRLAIQAAIDYAGGRFRVGIDGKGQYDIDSTLLVGTGTYIDAGEAKIYLMGGSNCAMLSNSNKTTPGSMSIVDSAITIKGGHWFGNGDNQIKFMPDGTPVVGFLFAGVKYLDFSPRRIVNTQTYAVFSTNVSYSNFHDLEIDQGVYNPPLHNQDGLHFNGPAHHINVSRCIFKTFDDAIAFNTEDVPQGPWLTQGDITDILIDDIIFNETRKGIRLLSATSLMDRIIVNNITGTATDNLLEVSAYGLGAGNFGDLTISNVNVKMQNNISNNEYLSFNNKIRSIYIDNVIRKPDNSIRTTITVKPLADIDILQARNVKTIADTTFNYTDIVTQTGAVVRRMVIDNYRYVGGKPGKSTGIAINGSTINTLEVNNSSFDSLLTAVAISNSSLKTLRLSGNSSDKVYNAIFLNASPIADTLHLYGSVMVDTANNAFRTVGFASIGRIKSYLPTVSVPGAQAAFAPIRYSYSSVQYTLNPVNTIDLQTVTNANGVTTNMMKVTGVTNIRNGNGLELFSQSGIGNLWSYDRGGTNTLQPLLVAGTPVMLNTRALVGVNTTATDDGSTTLQIKGSISKAYTVLTGTTTLNNTHCNVDVNNSANVVINLPAISTCPGREYTIAKSSNNAFTVTVTANGAETINGVNTNVLGTQYSSITIWNTGTTWRIK